MKKVKKENRSVSKAPEYRKYYLSEFRLHDGEVYITFNIVSIDTAKKEIQLAVTNRGKISVITYDLYTDKDGKLYFEYGCMYEHVYLADFKKEEV